MPEPLWERDTPLFLAAGLVSGLRAGHGGALFVQGDGGSGKTSVLDAVSREAADGVRLATARCEPMETTLPFGLLTQVGRALGAAGHEDLVTAASGRDGVGARATATYRALRWLEEVASGPVLVTIDDLHWADPDSLACLGLLCRRLAGLPVAVVASLRARPAGAADLARGLVNRGDAALTRLAPLSEQAALGLLRHRHGAVPASVADRAWQVSGGNPLLLGLAAGLLVDGAPGTPGEPLVVPDDERSLVLGRFSGLTPAEQGWGRAAAVLGVGFDAEVVGEVADVAASEGEAAAEGLWQNGLVRSAADGRAEFVQPLFAQLLYDDIAPPLRSRLHARAFTALRDRGLHDVAAEHAIRGRMVGHPEAIEVLVLVAGRALQAGAPRVAVSRLQAAVHLSGDAAAAPLVVGLAGALVEAGRPGDAVATLTDLLGTDLLPRTRVEALTTISRAHFSMGRLDRAGTALRTATDVAEHACPELVALPLAQHATAVLMTAGPATALPIAERARTMARGGDPRVRAQAAATWGLLAFWCGDSAGLETARAEGRHLLGGTRADLSEDLRAGAADVLGPFASTAALAGHFAEAEAAFRAGIQQAERMGAVNAMAALRIGYCAMLLRTRVGDGLAVADELLATADLVPLAEPFARAMRSQALMEQGRDAESVVEQGRAEAIATPAGLWLCTLRLQHVRGLRLLRAGRVAEASAVFTDLEERERMLGIGEPCTVPYARHAVVAHTRSGDLGAAARVLSRLDASADALPCRWPRAAAAAGRAQLALHQDRRSEADSLYRTAADILEDASLPLDLAEVLLDHGAVLRQDGRTEQARDAFRRSAQLATSVGGVWLARRGAEELTAVGGRHRPRRPADELTPQERRVARLAATGASDKDIATHLAVSVRTVRTHLEHVYTKLRIHSRRDLMLREQGERPADRGSQGST